MAAPKPIGFDNWRAFFFLSKDGSGNKFWIKASFCVDDGSGSFRLFRGPSITSVTGGASAVTVVCSENHGFHTNQKIRLHGLPNNLNSLLGVDHIITVTNSTTFTITTTTLNGQSCGDIGAMAGVDIGTGILTADYTMAPGRLCIEDYPDPWELPFEG